MTEEERVKGFEESVGNADVPLAQRREIEGMLPNLKRTLAQSQAREQQWRNQANDIAASIAAEQNRWSDFNARLDELERSLTTTLSVR
jgi:hypothetical protein